MVHTHTHTHTHRAMDSVQQGYFLIEKSKPRRDRHACRNKGDGAVRRVFVRVAMQAATSSS